VETNGWLELVEEHLEKNGSLGKKEMKIFIEKSLVPVGSPTGTKDSGNGRIQPRTL
jgi:hypothetical protein